MNRLWVSEFETPLGSVHIATTTKGLALLTLPGGSDDWFRDRLKSVFEGHEISDNGALNARVEKQVKEYFAGKRRRFDLPLDLHAAPFHARVLREVAKIPFGETRTYGEIARAVRNPNASRAVGTANARNLIPIVIPCHRVVASSGLGLGGYGGGLEMKKFLLRLESVSS
jgi:methylated-DNA-[protein]-cysteine S-methyltransferase